MKIQRLSADDWQRLKSLRLEALQDAPLAFGNTLGTALGYNEENWRRQLNELVTFVVVKDSKDFGMARGGPDHANTNRAFLLSMWVAPHGRGTGAGERLINAVIDWAREAGFNELALDVADDNQPAIALYERLYFLPTGETGSLPPPRTHVLEHRRAIVLV